MPCNLYGMSLIRINRLWKERVWTISLMQHILLHKIFVAFLSNTTARIKTDSFSQKVLIWNCEIVVMSKQMVIKKQMKIKYHFQIGLLLLLLYFSLFFNIFFFIFIFWMCGKFVRNFSTENKMLRLNKRRNETNEIIN